MIFCRQREIPLFRLLGAILIAQVILWLTAVCVFAVPEETAAPETSPPQEVRIVVAGDIITHMPLVKSAYRAKTKDYDFAPVFAEIAPLLKGADLTLANLETTFANDRKYTGYPRFNAPSQLAGSLKQAGFNLLVTANNHSLDYGEKGVRQTLKVLADAGLQPLGTAPDEKSRKPCLIEKKGIKIGLLAYTCLTNNRKVPKGKDYLLNVFNRARAARDLDDLRERGAELILCYLHFGEEYQRYPSKTQVEIVDFLQQKGVDIVLGSHPHVVQPGAFSSDKSKLAVYSLGNLISCQRSNFTDVGVLVDIRVVKEQNKVRVAEVDYVPTYVSAKWVKNQPTYKIRIAKNIDRYLTRRYAKQLDYQSKSFHKDMLAHLTSGLRRD